MTISEIPIYKTAYHKNIGLSLMEMLTPWVALEI
jgi:hypothetical protein